ncbi:MAG TPA: hypothetical protein VF041_00850 [Gemmatimonadaceae bacterium]
MKTYLVRRAGARPTDVAGRILTRDVRDASGARAFAKGEVVHADRAPELLALDWAELHLIEAEPGEVHEQEAGRRIAEAAAGEGTVVGDAAGGHWPVTSTRRGLLRVNVRRLARVNGVEGACVYTLWDGQIVEPGEVVARAKITPFVIDGRRIDEVERLTRGEDHGVAHVRPFLPTVVGAVVQETLGERAMTRFREALAGKIAWFGSRLLEPEFAPPAGDDVAAAMERVVATGARVLVMAGAKALDPLDPAFVALDRLGVSLERFGAPAHPGSLFWLARLGDVPVLGMPSCGLFSQATVFDLVLPRVLAGERVGRAEIGALGHGGLITRDLAFRFPRYRAEGERGELA